ncbi:Asp-tRNA(Asn)/Glu-tRNA(Gln) amidotransferase subunit GatC [Candidatus Neptunochlamydia vexilliferae]|uniref:Aspartyl/glutamyl-tRNA(Asn/Gln) amidotransferase subunit C n=1 Tax=Candidatus Neptunichlamydia vexilliferae TaxID=1651774 RepID=A0ABS0AZC0_9BACT|nr:Asp-tRNA(Asn)/Glu-tRNA(Gln) amidotransferase subunit GatC [Candidatus Neptunochlamydia vexilliferae]MBF5059476.1 Aspartyl/glutamyl-tRNA(Asn/Gln) amidotransferase subunit C [Candidatus Neptunochlamydia vexilliferae]
MSNLDKETIEHLTRLSRIRCSEKEVDTLLKNLQSILGYIDQMKEVDTEDVPVCNHVSEEIGMVVREDEVSESLPRETFLENSPSQVGGMIRVPPVIK